jgi:hypothetical protein
MDRDRRRWIAGLPKQPPYGGIVVAGAAPVVGQALVGQRAAGLLVTFGPASVNCVLLVLTSLRHLPLLAANASARHWPALIRCTWHAMRWDRKQRSRAREVLMAV